MFDGVSLNGFDWYGSRFNRVLTFPSFHCKWTTFDEKNYDQDQENRNLCKPGGFWKVAEGRQKRKALVLFCKGFFAMVAFFVKWKLFTFKFFTLVRFFQVSCNTLPISSLKSRTKFLINVHWKDARYGISMEARGRDGCFCRLRSCLREQGQG